MSIGLIALDMDGTLLGPGDAMSPGNAEALREAVRAGMHLLICTGRIVQDISLFMENAGLFRYWMAGCNGAHILDGPGGKVVAKQLFPVALGRRVQEIVLQSPVLFTAILPQEIVYTSPEGAPAPGGEFTLIPDYPIHRDPERMRRVSEEGVLKYVAYDVPNHACLAEVKQRLRREAPEVAAASSWVGNIELNAPGVDKGAAIRLVAEQLGIPREHVMAVGDQINDLPMLEWAGVGVAMGNAVEKVRQRCRYHTEECGRDGVAQAIRRYALEDRHGT